MTILKACIVCALPTPEPYCPAHTPKPWEGSKRRQKIRLSGGAEQTRAKRILERYKGVCHVCGKFGADQVDHKLALSEGGPDEEFNLAPIHAEPCHREKTATEAARARRRAAGVGVDPASTASKRTAVVGDGARSDLHLRGRDDR